MHTLSVASTWDGKPLTAAERVTVALRLEGGEVVVNLDAPYYSDAPPASPPGSTPRLWEHVDAQRRFLAYMPPMGESPDFHRLECFAPLASEL